MAQDSGATDSVSNEKSHFQTLGLRDDLPSIRDERGNFTKVLGIGTIVIRAAAEHRKRPRLPADNRMEPIAAMTMQSTKKKH